MSRMPPPPMTDSYSGEMPVCRAATKAKESIQEEEALKEAGNPYCEEKMLQENGNPCCETVGI